MIFLSLIGIGLGVAVWQAGHPVWGVVVGLLFGGGVGWKLLWAAFTHARPSIRRHSAEFIKAWEDRFGPILRGQQQTYPPPGAFPGLTSRHASGQASAPPIGSQASTARPATLGLPDNQDTSLSDRLRCSA